MGWMGHGKYDGDNTESVQISFIEDIIGENYLNVKNKFCGIYDFKAGTNIVHPEAVNYLHAALVHNKETYKKYCFKPKDETDALDIMMVVDFFLNHNYWSDELQAMYIESYYLTQALDILYEEAEDFDSPAQRKRVLKKFKDFVSLSIQHEWDTEILDIYKAP